MTGFKVDLERLDQIANTLLPQVAALMNEPVSRLAVPTGFTRAGVHTTADSFDAAYQGLCGLLADRQGKAVQAVDATIDTLREITALYRRADGQA